LTLATAAAAGLQAPCAVWIATGVGALYCILAAVAGSIGVQRRLPFLAVFPLVPDYRRRVLGVKASELGEEIEDFIAMRKRYEPPHRRPRGDTEDRRTEDFWQIAREEEQYRGDTDAQLNQRFAARAHVMVEELEKAGQSLDQEFQAVAHVFRKYPGHGSSAMDYVMLARGFRVAGERVNPERSS
jgi:hypothetical protein